MRNTMHLVNTSSIIYFSEWDPKGFEFMAQKYFAKVEKKSTMTVGSVNDEEEEGSSDVRIIHTEEVIKC